MAPIPARFAAVLLASVAVAAGFWSAPSAQAPGGTVALISPQEPEWFQERGYELREYPVPEIPVRPDLTAYFGPLTPPNTLLVKTV